MILVVRLSSRKTSYARHLKPLGVVAGRPNGKSQCLYYDERDGGVAFQVRYARASVFHGRTFDMQNGDPEVVMLMPRSKVTEKQGNARPFVNISRVLLHFARWMRAGLVSEEYSDGRSDHEWGIGEISETYGL